MKRIIFISFGVVLLQSAKGQLMFQKTFRFNSASAWHIEKTSDNGYILCGNPFALIKTNAQGDTLWTKKSVTGNETLYCVRQTADGGYIASGSYYNPSTNESDALL